MNKIKKVLSEEKTLFKDIYRWYILSIMVGIVVGLATTVFLKLLSFCNSVTMKLPYHYLLLPVGLFISALIVKYLSPEAEGFGTEKVIESVHQQNGRIKWQSIPVNLAATIATIATGGSLGKEGPCALIGAGISSNIARLFTFNELDRKKLLICGISAGLASVFGAPIGGAIFGVEVLFVGKILYDVLLPSFISAIASYHISSYLGIDYFYNAMKISPDISQVFFIKIIIAGTFFGFVSIFSINLLKISKRISESMKIWLPLKGIAGGIILIILTLIFSDKYLGLGINAMESTLKGEPVVWYAFILKGIFTAITYGFGGCGGDVTPLFFIGTTAGAAFAQTFGLDISTFAAIGMLSLVSGAANVPLAASIIGMELFGTEIAPYITVACVISFLITGNRSVYSSQVLEFNKYPGFKGNIGHRLRDIEGCQDTDGTK